MKKPILEFTNDSEIYFDFLGYIDKKLNYAIFIPKENPLYQKIKDSIEELIKDAPSQLSAHPRYFYKNNDVLWFEKIDDSSLISNRWYQTKNMSLIQISSLFEEIPKIEYGYQLSK